MVNGNKSNKADSKLVIGERHIDFKEDKMLINNATDLCKKYLHEIRNMKSLDKEMINNIRNMSNEEKMNIILSLNEMFEYLKNMFE